MARPKRQLNYRQSLFVEHYTKILECKGNATQSAIKAGYKQRTAYSIGQRLLKHVEVKAEIDRITKEIKENSVATRVLRQEFWTAIMNDIKESMGDRLRASELLGKSEADFTENYADKTLQDSIPLTVDEIKELKRLAGLASNIKLKQPESAQEVG